MKAALIPLVFAVSAFAQSFTINTPANVAACQPLQLSWTGGTPPYFLTVQPGTQPNGPPLINLGQVEGTSFTWTKVNVEANTQIGFNLRDSNGALAQTASVTVNDSGDRSCLGQAPSGSSGSAPPATSAPSSPTAGAPTSAGSPPANSSPSSPATSPPANSPPAGSTSSRPATSAGASSTKSSASATSTNAASANMVQTGAAGIIGAALIALLA